MNFAPSAEAAFAAVAPAPSPSAGDDSALSAERPFPGLRPFGFADRAFFFGREKQTFALYRLVENGRFIAVVGSSGSGKSSLVLAGLKGLLAEESADPGGPTWVCLDMRPGASPLARLAKTLARLAEKDNPDEAARRREAIEYRLRQSSFSFESALEEAGGLGGRTLLLIVDQFEELFRFGLADLGLRRAPIDQTRARDEATQFVQILLDADRRRLKDVRVLITMRSDFIGDCSYFHGLPEAVSATQYLAPNLTRSQLEDVIRKPIEHAGATIEPELVERLLNDCSDELDQLPLLQHCLMRLWDRAIVACADGGVRHLTRRTYDDIGRMTEALSRHADAVLGQCVGKELAVEQAFRALSELDREGRAIRRALRFDKLLAETGVSESDLRAVLDKFRAPTCSFLVPPPSVASSLAPTDRVDIGHETLLRRWRKLAGQSKSGNAGKSLAARGWLADEQADGQRYRTLLSLLDGEAVLTDPKETNLWWDQRPRTEKWADRYGGRFNAVQKLVVDSVEGQRRRRRNRWLAVGVACIVLPAIAGWIGLDRINAARQQQEAIDTSAMRSAKTLLEQVLDAKNNQNLDLAGVRSLATVSEQFLNDTRASSKTSAADSLWAQSLNVASELQFASQNYVTALDLASKASNAARALTQSHPGDTALLRTLYIATIRIGDALTASGPNMLPDALDAYNEAVEIAKKVASLRWDDSSVDDLIAAHMRIGDVHMQIGHIRRDRQQRQKYEDALAEYGVGFSIGDKALPEFPESMKLLRDRGDAFTRIAQSLTDQESLAKAGFAYQQALVIRNTLVSEYPADSSLKSDLAATYMQRADIEKRIGNLDLALANLKAGVKLDKELVDSKRDTPDPQWQDYLAKGYLSVAEIAEQLSRPKDELMRSAWRGEALNNFRKYYEVKRELVFVKRRSAESRLEFAAAATLFGDHASDQEQVEAYRMTMRAWQRLMETPEDAKWAAAHFGDALRRGSSDLLRFANTFDAANDSFDAQMARNVAEKIDRLNSAKQP